MLVLRMVGWGSLSLIISCIFIVGISELGAVGRTLAVREEKSLIKPNILVEIS